jgi:hypothetical protein
MRLTKQQNYELFEKFGCHIKELCDRCGKGIGPVSYTRAGDTGVWCSRECRDGKETHPPGTCYGCGASLAGLRRGTKHCSEACRKRENRKSKTAQISRDEQLKTQDLQTRLEVLAICTHSALPEAPKEVFAQT